MEYEIESGSYRLKFEIRSEESYVARTEAYAVITGCEGTGSRLMVPEAVSAGQQTLPVLGLGKKAILANKSLREISLPPTIQYLDDWSLAQCENMQKVILRDSKDRTAQEGIWHLPGLSFGRSVFDKCGKIQEICLGYEEPDDLSALLGAVICRLPAEYLLKDKDLGRPEWFAKWDQCLSTYLNEPDLDGYTDMVLCGEEDIFYDEPDFAGNKRKKKAALCLLRLRHAANLEKEMRRKYTDYLLGHTKGCPSEEAWQVLLEEFGETTEYFKVFAEAGCVTGENIDPMLTDMGQRYAESKAFLLDYKQTHLQTADVFSLFDL